MGGGGGDDYILTPGTLGELIYVVEGADSASDTVSVIGTSGDDSVIIQPETPGYGLVSFVNLDGHIVSFNAAPGNLSVAGGLGNDSFNVTPLAGTTISVDGQAPYSTATGDSLTVTAPPGQTSSPSFSDAYDGTFHTTGGFGDVNFASIESVTVPLVTVVHFYALYGNGLSYDLSTTPTRDLPWQVTGFRAVFSEAVNASAGSLSFTGTGAPTVGSFSGSGTATVTWTLSSPATLANVTASIASSGPYAVTGASDNAMLDGNPNNPGPDPYSEAIKILYGDVDGDTTIGARDTAISLAASQMRAVPVAALYLDVNGDGKVDSADYNIVRSQAGKHL